MYRTRETKTRLVFFIELSQLLSWIPLRLFKRFSGLSGGFWRHFVIRIFPVYTLAYSTFIIIIIIIIIRLWKYVYKKNCMYYIICTYIPIFRIFSSYSHRVHFIIPYLRLRWFSYAVCIRRKCFDRNVFSRKIALFPATGFRAPEARWSLAAR